MSLKTYKNQRSHLCLVLIFPSKHTNQLSGQGYKYNRVDKYNTITNGFTISMRNKQYNITNMTLENTMDNTIE